MKTKQLTLEIKKQRKYKPLKKKDIRVIIPDEFHLWYSINFHFIRKKLEIPNWILNQRIKHLYEMLSTYKSKTKKTNME